MSHSLPLLFQPSLVQTWWIEMGLDIKQMWIGIENQHKASGQPVVDIKVTCVKINGDTLGPRFYMQIHHCERVGTLANWRTHTTCSTHSPATSATVFVLVFIDSFVVCSVFAYLKRDLLQRVIERTGRCCGLWGFSNLLARQKVATGVGSTESDGSKGAKYWFKGTTNWCV